MVSAAAWAAVASEPAVNSKHSQPCVLYPVLELRDDAIVVQKGKEKWEIARDKGTGIPGDLKVGSKVTVFYTMQAAKIEVKEAPKKK